MCFGKMSKKFAVTSRCLVKYIRGNKTLNLYSNLVLWSTAFPPEGHLMLCRVVVNPGFSIFVNCITIT